MKPRWRDVDPSALYLIPIFGMHGREWSGATQDTGQGAWKALRQVDDHEHRPGRSGGRLLTSFIRVSTPPDEAPRVTMSCRFNKILPRPSSTQDCLTLLHAVHAAPLRAVSTLSIGEGA